MKKILIVITIIISLYSLLYASPQDAEYTEAELISEVNSIKAGEAFWVALKLNMKPGWHVYWRNPGDTGIPVTINWDNPEGFSASEIHWPHPILFDLAGFISYCYENETFLLVQITPPNNLQTGDEVLLKASAEWLACKDICVPEDTEVSIKLTVTSGDPEINDQLKPTFTKARTNLPLPDSDWTIEASSQNNMLVISATPPDNYSGKVSSIRFFPYEKNLIDMNAEQSLAKVGRSYHISIPLSKNWKPEVNNAYGVLVSDKSWIEGTPEKSLEIWAKFQDELTLFSGDSVSEKIRKFALYIGFAFIGGMILNLMPCVLPVLSIKIMSFVQQAGEDRKKTIHHSFMFTAGVLASFWALAGILLILRAGGEQLGWGFQLQSIPFLIILSGFMLLFGLSMFGVFEIGTSLTGLGQTASGHSGYWGSFMTGITATVVATPCTAPFMGSALGFAFSQPPILSILIFTSLGLGMALPYVVLASSPVLLRRVPKPGAWMESLKQFMGFLLVATVIWLLWVLSIQAGADGVIVLIFSLFLISMGAWIYGRWGNITKAKKIRLIAVILTVILISGSIVFSLRNIQAVSADSGISQTKTQGKIEWQKFSPELIDSLRQEGKPVFIDFTASWCLSCQVNEKIAFGNTKVQEAFVEKGITTVKADWTTRDEIIARTLESFGRNSVPLYVLYDSKPDAEPVILPEIITPGIVLDALDKIGQEQN